MTAHDTLGWKYTLEVIEAPPTRDVVTLKLHTRPLNFNINKREGLGDSAAQYCISLRSI